MPITQIIKTAADPAFREELVDLLVEICQIDTTPRSDVARLRKNEAAIFEILERQFQSYRFEASSFERRAINPDIASHPFFSKLYYTQTAERPEGLNVSECYAGRSNLLLAVDGEQRTSVGVNFALNAHIDVIAPFIPPRVDGDTVFGRGACDDKGNVVALMGALKLVAAYLQDHLGLQHHSGLPEYSGLPKHSGRLNRHLTCMLVLDEESGGNGSLSLAMDRDLKQRYDSLTVLEICENRIYPGNRGCVWFKIEAKVPGVNMFEAAAWVVDQIEQEGRSIRAESDHPLFPHRPVQTCHGILGDCGDHPSRINGDISFDIRFGPGAEPAQAKSLITDILQFALEEYTGIYGDKTRIDDPVTGQPKVDHHYDLSNLSDRFTIRVFGATGHMGSIFENDGAITKMMTMVRALVRSRAALERAAGGSASCRLHGWDDASLLLLEGGQGFLPTHEMADIQQRLESAALRGAGQYFALVGSNAKAADRFEVSYEKLHNAAFAGKIESSDMQNAIACAKDVGMWSEEDMSSIRGWDVSCDARIFAKEYDSLEVITTGPGSLNHAHSDREQINIPEMIRSAVFLAHFILKQTGTIT